LVLFTADQTCNPVLTYVLREVWISILLFLSWAFKNGLKISFFSYSTAPSLALTCHWKIEFTPNCSQLNFRERYQQFFLSTPLNLQTCKTQLSQINYKVDVTSSLGRVSLDWGVAVSVFPNRWNRAIQPALTLFNVLLFATKARKIKNPWRLFKMTKR